MMRQILILMFWAPLFVFAQTEDLDANQKGFSNLSQAGKLFRVDVRPAGSELKVFLVGNEAADVKLKDASIEAIYGIGDKKRKVIGQKVVGPTGKSYYKFKTFKANNFQLKVKSGDAAESFSFKK